MNSDIINAILNILSIEEDALYIQKIPETDLTFFCSSARGGLCVVSNEDGEMFVSGAGTPLEELVTYHQFGLRNYPFKTEEDLIMCKESSHESDSLWIDSFKSPLFEDFVAMKSWTTLAIQKLPLNNKVVSVGNVADEEIYQNATEALLLDENIFDEKLFLTGIFKTNKLTVCINFPERVISLVGERDVLIEFEQFLELVL